MGRKNKTYYKDLHQQAYDRLTEMLAFGESKKEAVAEGTEKDKIFSVNTYKSYWKHIKYFLRYIKQKHPGVYDAQRREKVCQRMASEQSG